MTDWTTGLGIQSRSVWSRLHTSTRRAGAIPFKHLWKKSIAALGEGTSTAYLLYNHMYMQVSQVAGKQQVSGKVG